MADEASPTESTGGILTIEDQAYAVGLQWLPPGRTTAARAAKDRAKTLSGTHIVIRKGAVEQGGIGFSKDGHKGGQIAGAACLAEANFGRRWLAAVDTSLEGSGPWWVVVVLDDVIQPDGDALYYDERRATEKVQAEIAANGGVDQFDMISTPEAWGIASDGSVEGIQILQTLGKGPKLRSLGLPVDFKIDFKSLLSNVKSVNREALLKAGIGLVAVGIVAGGGGIWWYMEEQKRIEAERVEDARKVQEFLRQQREADTRRRTEEAERQALEAAERAAREAAQNQALAQQTAVRGTPRPWASEPTVAAAIDGCVSAILRLSLEAPGWTRGDISCTAGGSATTNWTRGSGLMSWFDAWASVRLLHPGNGLPVGVTFSNFGDTATASMPVFPAAQPRRAETIDQLRDRPGLERVFWHLGQVQRERVNLNYRGTVLPPPPTQTQQATGQSRALVQSAAQQVGLQNVVADATQGPQGDITPSRYTFNVQSRLPITEWREFLGQIPATVIRRVALSTTGQWTIEGEIFDANPQNQY